MREYLTPWNIHKVTRPRDLERIAVVRDHLIKKQLFVERWAKADKRVRKSTITVLDKVLTQRPVNLIVVCNSIQLMQSLAETVSITFALTERRACSIVTNDTLMELFMSRVPADIWEDYPAGEILSDVENSGILVWKHPGVPCGGLSKMEARTMSIVTSRQGKKRAVLLVKGKPGEAKTVMEPVTEDLIAALGSTAGSTLAENSGFLSLSVSKINIEFDRVEV